MPSAGGDRLLSWAGPRSGSVLLPEAFAIPLEPERYIIYAPLRRAALVGSRGVVRFLARLQSGAPLAPSEQDGPLIRFLEAAQMVGGPPEMPPVTSFTGDPQPVSVTLLLTTACNLRCKYCYASTGARPVETMGAAVAKGGIDFVIASASKLRVPYIEVSYHGGGEPTLNWPVLTGSLDYARQQAAKERLEVRGSITTNGVLADEQIDWICANLSGATVSFDGLPSVHDSNRVSAAGEATSDRVVRTLRRFDEVRFPYGIRATVTRDHVHALPDSIEFIYANFRPNSVQVEPVYRMGRGRECESAESVEFIDSYRQAQQRAGSHGGELTFSAARIGILTDHFCAATRDNFCLSAGGNVTSCYEVFSEDNRWAKRFFYGRPDLRNDGYSFDHAVLDGLRSQSVHNREYCRGCFAKWTCGGDCYHKSLEVNGDGEFRGAGRCHVTRELTKDLILAKIASSGGLFWREPRADHHDEAGAAAAGSESQTPLAGGNGDGTDG